MNNITVASRLFEELWNKNKLDIASEIFADDAVFHGLVGQYPPGLDGFIQYAETTRASFSDIHFTIEDCIAMNDRVVIRWSSTSTHESEWMGAPGTGKRVGFTGTSIYRMVDGKIVEVWSNFDLLGLFQQVGFQLVPPNAENN